MPGISTQYRFTASSLFSVRLLVSYLSAPLSERSFESHCTIFAGRQLLTTPLSNGSLAEKSYNRERSRLAYASELAVVSTTLERRNRCDLASFVSCSGWACLTPL